MLPERLSQTYKVPTVSIDLTKRGSTDSDKANTSVKSYNVDPKIKIITKTLKEESQKDSKIIPFKAQIVTASKENIRKVISPEKLFKTSEIPKFEKIEPISPSFPKPQSDHSNFVKCSKSYHPSSRDLLSSTRISK